MPRDDLTIDFVKTAQGMPPQEVLDPALILDDWANRVANLPEEIKFIQDEVTEKDRQVAECIRIIENRDGRIQAWIKQQGSHTPNPREASYRTTIKEQYFKAEQLSEDKLNLTRKLQVIMDRHLKVLDRQIKQLYDRNEPGFTDPDDLPSLLRPSAANNSAPSARAVNPSAANPIVAALSPLAIPTGGTSGPKGAGSQIRSIQTTVTHAASSSAPTSPAATMSVKRGARESSAGPGTTGTLQRGPRSAVGLGSAPNTSSGLARHSSLGPGTPKGHTAAATGGVPRAGSAGPGRTAIKGGASAPGGRKGTPSGGPAGGRTLKKGTPAGGGPKSGLQRVRKSAKNSPSSAAESELSEADSVEVSGEDSDGPPVRRGTPAHGGRGHGGGGGSMSQIEGSSIGGRAQGTGPAPRTKRSENHHHGHSHDAHDDRTYVDDDEAGDDKKYCICQKVSFGDMIACDNEECPYEWFHWACVGLKSEPVAGGTWYCPVCTQQQKKDKGKSN